MSQNTLPRVLLVCCALITDTDNKILLIRRSQSSSRARGKWELPGGKVESNQTLLSCLEREVFEETGIEITKKSIHDAQSRILLDNPYKGMLLVTITYMATAKDKTVKLSEEHDSYKWVSSTEVGDYDLREETRNSLKSL